MNSGGTEAESKVIQGERGRRLINRKCADFTLVFPWQTYFRSFLLFLFLTLLLILSLLPLEHGTQNWNNLRSVKPDPPGPPDIREEVGNVVVEGKMELTCPG